MKKVTVKEMKSIDQRAIEEYRIPSLLLMENAGRGISELITHAFKDRPVVVCAGKGHNGGDGLVVARHLFNRGVDVYVLVFGSPESLSKDTRSHFDILSKMGVRMDVADEGFVNRELGKCLDRADIVVDALLGMGLSRNVEGLYAKVINLINEKSKNTVAVDVPSGLNADTGMAMGVAVKAHITATLGLPKVGLFAGDGATYAGKIAVIEISIPRQLLAEPSVTS